MPVILDHENGNNLDNRPRNLRYLCPNCDSQLATRGGKNRGRVIEAEDGSFVLADPDGRQNRFILINTADAVATGQQASVKVQSDIAE